MTDPVRILNCGCLRRVSLKAHPLGTGDLTPQDVFCHKHGWTTIAATNMEEWHALCRDCPWGDWIGTDNHRGYGVGSFRAGKHSRAHRGHRVTVIKDRHTRDGRGEWRRDNPRKDSARQAADDPLELPVTGADEPPPF